MKAILTLLLVSSLIASAAETTPQPKNQPVITAGAETKVHTPSTNSVFLFPNSNLLSLGKLTIAKNATAEGPKDLKKIAGDLNNTKWHMCYVMVNKKDGIHVTYFLAPAAQSAYGLIGLTDLPGHSLDVEKTLVDAAAGITVTFSYDKNGLLANFPGAKPIVIATISELDKAQAALSADGKKVALK